MTEIKVGIVGSRRRDTASDFRKVWNAYDEILNRNSNDYLTIVSGGAYKGADGKMITYFPFGHDTLDYYARNNRIAEESDILIACVAPDRKGGTENTILQFKKHNPNGEIIIVE